MSLIAMATALATCVASPLKSGGRWSSPLLLGLAGVAAYHNSFSSPFLFDDLAKIGVNS